MPRIKELSLRPYSGRLFLATTRTAYEKAHQKLFGVPDPPDKAYRGRFSSGADKKGDWAYLVWAKQPHILAHEFSHILFHVFDRAGMDPRDSKGEAFCYMLSQLMLDAKHA